MAPKAAVLVVEDDPDTAIVIEECLKAEGYEVRLTRSLFQAKGSLAKAWPDLMVLDRNLPDGDGLDFCQEIRADVRSRSLPILFLTTQKSLAQKVAGLQLGGDDYLAKPFHAKELVARIAVLLRRVRGEEQERPMISAGGLELDLVSRHVKIDGKLVELRAKEFDLLVVFLKRRNVVLSRPFLLDHVWGYDQAANVNSKVVDVTVGNLRDKIGAFGKKIVSVRSHGYQFEWEER